MGNEMLDMTIAILVLGFVVSYNGPGSIETMLRTFLPNTMIIGMSFLVHELAHRETARKLGFFARFELWSMGVLLSILLSLAGNIGFAAVGAVMVYPVADLWGRMKPVTPKDMFLIAVAGPVSNIILAAVSLAAFFIYNSPWLVKAAYLNLWLAVFNLIPFPPLDGSRIFSYSWKAWVAVFLPVLVAFSYVTYIL